MKLKHIYLLVIILLQIILLPSTSTAKDFNLQEFKDNLPKLLGSNNAGTEFWITFNPSWETHGALSNLKIYISSQIETNVTVEVTGKGYKRQQTTIPNDIIEFTLTPALGQCYRKTDRQPPQPDTVYPGYGIHVFSDQPIIVYGLSNYEYTSDSYLALPLSSLGKEYVVASWPDISDNGIQYMTCYTSIVSPYDDNIVSFTMGGTQSSKTAGGQLPGETRNYNLSKGDVLLIGSLGNFADLTGSHIKSTKPFSVISSNFCAFVPDETSYCDYMCEMELPVYTWGKHYFYTPIFGRLKNSMIRIFSKEPGTKLFRDGMEFAYLDSASGLENMGWISIRADVGEPRPIVFSGNKPIYVEQYNCGQNDDNIVSDPFMMALTPYELFQKEITFNTPCIREIIRFYQNYINIVYKASENDSIPEDMEFANVQGGKFVWKKLSDLDPKPGETFRYLISGKKYFCKTILLPGNGVYKIRAKEPFAAYAYGFSPYDSYGHPASVSLLDLSKSDFLPPKPSFIDKCYDNIVNAAVEDLPNDSTNRSNLSMIIFHSDSSYNYNFSYDEFIAREDYMTNWNASVIDKSKEARAIITFADAAGNDTTIVIEYEPKDVVISSDSMFFGNKEIGTDTTIIMFVHNYTNSVVNIDSVYLKNKNNGFEILNVTLPDTLQPGDTLFFDVKFNATEEGLFSDSIGVAGECFYKENLRAIVSVLSVTTGVDFSIITDEFNISPNPFSSNITLDILGNNKPVTIIIYDIFCRTVLTKQIEFTDSLNTQHITLNTESLPQGVYFVRVQERGGTNVIFKVE